MLYNLAKFLQGRLPAHNQRHIGLNFACRVFLAILVYMVIATPRPASAAAVTRPEFDVATVKLNVSGCCTSSKWSSDQVTFSNQTLQHLIIFAYKLQPQQVSGPKWMESVRFDVTAKYPPGTQFKDRLLMLQSLLEDRFELAVHHDAKEMQAYELVVATTGFKLKTVEPGEGSYSSGEEGAVRSFRARKISMFDFAYDLADSLGEPVIDKTGLDGVYDFQLTWAADDLSSNQDTSQSAPSMFAAIRESLGLRLLHRKTSIPIVVVDHVTATPSNN